jgi:hypothetical protein
MDNFKSFNDFLKEQHGGKTTPSTQEVPVEQTPPPPHPAKKNPGKRLKRPRFKGKAYAAGGLGVLAVIGLSLFFLPIPIGYIDLPETDGSGNPGPGLSHRRLSNRQGEGFPVSFL